MTSTMYPQKRPVIRHKDEGDAYWFLGARGVVKTAGGETADKLTVLELTFPTGFGPPLHRHLDDEEVFYVLDGTIDVYCEERWMTAEAGDLVALPSGVPHAFVVASDVPARALGIYAPTGFEGFVADIGVPARDAGLPEDRTMDPEVIAPVAARHHIELIGPRPERT